LVCPDHDPALMLVADIRTLGCLRLCT
jgi:hypothetical protein